MNSPPDEDAPLQRELLGHVWVDSGRLIVTDPAYLDQLLDQEEGTLSPLESRANVFADGMAMVFHTGPRTGRYPVYVTRFQNGCLAKVEIELDERASPIE